MNYPDWFSDNKKQIDFFFSYSYTCQTDRGRLPTLEELFAKHKETKWKRQVLDECYVGPVEKNSQHGYGLSYQAPESKNYLIIRLGVFDRGHFCLGQEAILNTRSKTWTYSEGAFYTSDKYAKTLLYFDKDLRPRSSFSEVQCTNDLFMMSITNNSTRQQFNRTSD